MTPSTPIIIHDADAARVVISRTATGRYEIAATYDGLRRRYRADTLEHAMRIALSETDRDSELPEDGIAPLCAAIREACFDAEDAMAATAATAQEPQQ